MSETSKDIEDLRRAVRRLWPKVRPYWLTATWLVLILGLAWDVKRFVTGHPQELSGIITFYIVVIGSLILEYLVVRKLRREAAEGDGDS